MIFLLECRIMEYRGGIEMKKIQLYQFTSQTWVGLAFLIVASVVGAYIPYELQQFINGEATQQQRFFIVIISLFMTQAVSAMIGQYMLAQFAEKQILQLRSRVVETVLNATTSYVDTLNSGELASRVVNDTAILKNYLVGSFPQFIAGSITISISLIFLVVLDWKLTIVLFTVLPLMALITIPLSNLNSRYAKSIQEETSALNASISESIQEVPTIKVMNLQSAQLQSVRKRLSNLYTVQLKNDRMDAITTPVAMFVIFSAVAIIFVYGGMRVQDGSLTIGVLVSFLMYLFQLLNPFASLTQFGVSRAKMKAALSQIAVLLEAEQERTGGVSMQGTGDLYVDHVSFQYQDSLILKNVTMHIPRHQKVAIVGPSGSGKSTLVHLIEGLYREQQGHIRIGDCLQQEMSLKSWRAHFSVVSQNGGVFTGTIRENLCYGVQQRPTNEELNQVLRQVNLWEDVQKMPQQLDTFVGERGKLLSGGQRQRIQIARALLRKTAPFIILDEATANLDADTEMLVNQTLKNLLQEKTLLVIAHRLSSVQDANCIYFLDDGVVTGVGTHVDLYSSHQRYRQFVDEQMID